MNTGTLCPTLTNSEIWGACGNRPCIKTGTGPGAEGSSMGLDNGTTGEHLRQRERLVAKDTPALVGCQCVNLCMHHTSAFSP